MRARIRALHRPAPAQRPAAAAAGELAGPPPPVPRRRRRSARARRRDATVDRLVCVAIVLSVTPVVDVLTSEGKSALLAGLIGVLALLLRSRGIRLPVRDASIVGGFAALAALHVATFGPVVVNASAAFLLRIVAAALAIRAVTDFHRHYVRVLHGLAWISFAFYLPVLLGVDLAGMLGALRLPLQSGNTSVLHVGIHNFHLPEHSTRNSGIFHEPGAFAGYLALAVLLGLFEAGRRARRRRAVMLVALLSTLSTTAYVALAPVAVMLVVARKLAASSRAVYRHLVTAAAVVGVAGWVAFETLPFMKEKISAHLEDVAMERPWAKIDRIGNFLYDVDHISRRPLTGWSPRHTTRLHLDPEVIETVAAQGNGLSGFAVRYGLIGLGLFAVTAFAFFRRTYGSGLLAALALGVVAILLTGEQYLDGSVFLSLMFVPAALPFAVDPTRRRGPAPRRAARVVRGSWADDRPPGDARAATPRPGGGAACRSCPS
jgi:hypothetical protein